MPPLSQQAEARSSPVSGLCHYCNSTYGPCNKGPPHLLNCKRVPHGTC
jgi:hypothetical protein